MSIAAGAVGPRPALLLRPALRQFRAVRPVPRVSAEFRAGVSPREIVFVSRRDVLHAGSRGFHLFNPHRGSGRLLSPALPLRPAVFSDSAGGGEAQPAVYRGFFADAGDWREPVHAAFWRFSGRFFGGGEGRFRGYRAVFLPLRTAAGNEFDAADFGASNPRVPAISAIPAVCGVYLETPRVYGRADGGNGEIGGDGGNGGNGEIGVDGDGVDAVVVFIEW